MKRKFDERSTTALIDDELDAPFSVAPEPLFQKLFKYRQTEKHTPLENFVTEAFAHLLNAMPRHVADNLVSDLLLPNEEARAGWRSRGASRRLMWSTQYRCKFGILDILLEADGEPMFVIENKIGAGFGHNQLENYAKFLRAARGAQFSALAVITHTSRVPDHFLGANASRRLGEPWRQARSWADVWRWLRAAVGTINSSKTTLSEARWTVLANQFMDFLEIQHMSANSATQTDFAAAMMFLGAAERFEQMFDQFSDQLRKTSGLSELIRSNKKSAQYRTDTGAISQYAEFIAPRKLSDHPWELGWGIRFPEMPGWFAQSKPPTPKVPFAFIYVTDTTTFELPFDRLAVPKGTSLGVYKDVENDEPITYVAAFRAIHAFAEEAGREEFGEKIAQWWEQCAIDMRTWLIGK